MNAEYIVVEKEVFYGVKITRGEEERTIFFTEDKDKAEEAKSILSKNEVTPITMGYILDDLYPLFN